MKSKIMNRLLAGLLCLVMFFSGVLIPEAFVVAKAEESVTLPEVKNLIWEEKFEDTELNGNWTAKTNYTNGIGAVDTENQVFRITRTSTTGGGLYQDIYFDQKATNAYNGYYALELEIKKSSDAKIAVQVYSSEKIFVSECTTGGRWDFYGYESLNGSENKVQVKTEALEYKLTYLFDTANSKVSVWVDGVLKIQSTYTAADATSGLKYMRIVSNDKIADTTIEVDNIRFYETYPMTAAERFAADAENLTQESLVDSEDTAWTEKNQISSNLILPTTGANLSTITWSSSNTSVITNDGLVTCADEVMEVIMTATITSTGWDGSTQTDTKTFTFSVAAKAVEETSVLPEEKNLVWEEFFEDTTLNGNWNGTTTTTSTWAEVVSGTSLSNYYNYTNGSGSVDTTEQVFFITRNNDSEGKLYQNVYFDAGRSCYSGIYCLELSLTKNAPEVVKLRVDSKSSAILTNIAWNEDGSLTATYYEDEARPDNEEKVKTIGNYADGTINVRFLFNTTASKVSVWVNDVLKVDSKYTEADSANGIRYLRVSLDGNAGDSLDVDNIRFYEAYPMTAAERVALDKAALTADKLVDTNDSYYSGVGKVSCNLTLPTEGENKTTITWESSNPDVISDSGVVTRTDIETIATLTATIKSTVNNVEETDTVEFVFSVAAREQLSDEESVAKVLEYLTAEVVSPLDDPTDGIIRSLSLPTYNELHECSISWSSSNEAYITDSGRVIRPRYDEEDVEVTLTGTITRGDIQKTKTYTFLVLADQEFVDPEHMTDEEFFGVWDETTSSWTTVGKFDYTYQGLEDLEAAVKATGSSGDYTLAKEALLDYFKNDRSQEAVMLSEDSRNALWADATINGFQFVQNAKYCTGLMSFGTEWGEYTANLALRDINAGSTISYNLQSWYNEDNYVEIARSTSADETMKPRLVLTVNGEVKTFYAVEDAIIQSGVGADQNFSSAENLKVYTYGDFLDDGHTRALIKFNTGLTGEDVVTEAKLILYGKMTGAGSEKQVFISYEPDSTWSGSTVTWNSMDGLVYSFNGLGDSNEADSGVSSAGMWEIMDGCLANYPKQITRFDCWNEIAFEYVLTGNEQYAYSAIRIMEGFIRDRGGWKSSTTKMDLPAYEDPNGLRGGYATTLTASQREGYWLDVLPVLLESEYATADFITALLKNLWDTGKFLTVYNTKSGNWRQTEMTALLDLGTRLPELYDAQNGKNWHDMGRSALEELIFTNTFEDGSYQESTEAYGTSSLGTFAEFKQQLIDMGTNTSEEYDERLQKLALYQALLYANDGSSAQYGDSADTTRKVDKFESVYKWFNDRELEYIVTYGASGTQPEWTSKTFEESGVTTLRSDWSTNGTWIFTNVRGGGNHGHKDYNSIVLHAFGRRLLIDSGYFEYDASNDYTAYGKSTEGHNTVMINDTSQETFFDANNPKTLYGTVHSFFTNNAYDYLEQSTPNTPGYEHRRSITFIKSGLVIVSDLMTPEDLTKDNNYKQLWHLPAESNYSVSADNLTIQSAYQSGANIVLAAAKNENITAVKSDRGWRSRTYGRVEDAPYAYFEVDGAGIQTMDTVLVLTEDDPTATVTAEKLESRENTTAMKFDMVTKDGSFTGYYLQSYDGEGGNFGPFSTDAHTAYVLLDAEGNVKEMLFNEGTYIRYMEGNISLVEATEEQESLFVELAGTVDYLDGSIVYMTGDEETIDSVKVLAQDDCLGIVVNDTFYTYDIVEGYITNIGAGDSSTEENLPPLEIILEGTETSYQNGSDEDVSIHCTGDLEKLTGVQMDGADVDENNYTLTEGSTIVTFKTEYLETLSVGEHTVTLLYTDSQVESKLEILATADNSDENSTSTEKDDSADDSTSTESDASDVDDTTSTEQEAVEENSATHPSAVQAAAAPTGDSQNILLWLVVLGCGIIAMVLFYKKEQK